MLQRYEIRWIDSTAWDDPWMDLEKAKAKRLAIIYSVGYLLCKDETQVSIVQSYGEKEGDNGQIETEVGGLFGIPTGCILEMEELNEDWRR